MAKKVYFKDGFLEVTSEFVKARTRTIQLATLESVHISRTLFLGTLALCGGMILFGLLFADLLYVHEIALLVGIGAALLWLSWNFGTFTVYSKLTGAKGWAVTWWIKPLQSMRAAVETALEDQSAERRRTKKRGAAARDDEDEEEDANA